MHYKIGYSFLAVRPATGNEETPGETKEFYKRT
jgi:hypothetical protein